MQVSFFVLLVSFLVLVVLDMMVSADPFMGMHMHHFKSKKGKPIAIKLCKRLPFGRDECFRKFSMIFWQGQLGITEKEVPLDEFNQRADKLASMKKTPELAGIFKDIGEKSAGKDGVVSVDAFTKEMTSIGADYDALDENDTKGLFQLAKKEWIGSAEKRVCSIDGRKRRRWFHKRSFDSIDEKKALLEKEDGEKIDVTDGEEKEVSGTPDCKEVEETIDEADQSIQKESTGKKILKWALTGLLITATIIILAALIVAVNMFTTGAASYILVGTMYAILIASRRAVQRKIDQL